MLETIKGTAVTIHFLDGSCEKGGTLEEIADGFVRYRTEYQLLYIPVTSIRAVAVDTKERRTPRVGFGE